MHTFSGYYISARSMYQIRNLCRYGNILSFFFSLNMKYATLMVTAEMENILLYDRTDRETKIHRVSTKY